MVVVEVLPWTRATAQQTEERVAVLVVEERAKAVEAEAAVGTGIARSRKDRALSLDKIKTLSLRNNSVVVQRQQLQMLKARTTTIRMSALFALRRSITTA